MIDFKNKDLYKRESVRMQRFLKYKLVTNSEQEQRELEELAETDGSNTLEAGDFYEGDSFEIGDDSSLGGFDESSFGGFGDAGERSGVKNAQDWQQESLWKTFLIAPLFLIKYVFIDITEDFPRRHEWKDILKALNTINIISIITTIIAFAIGVKTIFTPGFQFLAGLIMFVLTTVIVYFVYKEETKTIEIVKHLLGITEKEQVEGEFSFEESTMDIEEDAQGELLDINVENTFSGGLMDFSDHLGIGETEQQTKENQFDFDMDQDSEEYEYEEIETEEDDGEDGEGLPGSPIQITNDEVFSKGLLDVYAQGDINTGKTIPERGKLVESFSGYLIQNDSSFGKWVRPKERGIEYNNIAYALFKGLSIIETRFGSYGEDQTEADPMVVLDIRKSPLLYRIELELPEYIKESKIQRNIKVIEDVLRVAEDDMEVAVLVTTFQGSIVIKLLRLGNRKLVSLGDILRFKDENRGYIGMDAFYNDSYGLPILFGLQNNENPYVLDWEANTSGTIVGASGSGKSWTTFLMMLNFIISNDYNNLNFIVLDVKNAPFWNAYARLPHVLGYHYEIDTFIDVLREVEEERKRRQKLLNELGAESMKGYRKALREKGELEKLKEVPLLFLVIDEITATMLEFKEQDEELFKTAVGLLGQISSKGRSAGVRILSIGQRSTFDSIPKTLMANSSFKFGMKMEVENDFITMFGKDIEKYNYPNDMGMGLSKTEEVMQPQMVKTLTIGGKNDEQMLMLIRSLAFDWIRRGHGIDNLEKMPKGMNIEKSYNRDQFYKMSKQEMIEGRILKSSEVNPGYEFNFTTEENQEAGYRIKQSQKRQQIETEKEEEINTEYNEEETKTSEIPGQPETQQPNVEDEENENIPNLEQITDESFEPYREDGDLFQKEREPTLTVEEEKEEELEDEEDEIELDFDFDFNLIEVEDEEIELDVGEVRNEEPKIDENITEIDQTQNIEETKFNRIEGNNRTETEKETEIDQIKLEEKYDMDGIVQVDTKNITEMDESKIEGFSESIGRGLERPDGEKGRNEGKSLDELMEEARKESENGREKLSEVVRKPARTRSEETTTYGSENGRIDTKVDLDRLINPETTSNEPTSLEDHLKVHSHVHSEKESEKGTNSVSLFDLLGNNEEEELDQNEVEMSQENTEETNEREIIEQEQQRQEEQERKYYEQLQRKKQEEELLRAQKEAERQEQLLKEQEAKKQGKLEIHEKLRKEREEVERERQKLKEQKAKNETIQENVPERVESSPKEDITKNLNKVDRTEQIRAQTRNQQKQTARTDSGRDGINLGFSSASEGKKHEPDLSIKEYIAKYGQSKGFNIYLRKEEIEAVYSKRRINEALDRMVMVEADDFYVIRM